jgi:hypothetical protein
MITENDIKIVDAIKKYIDKDIFQDDSQNVDWEKVVWCDILDKLVSNLKIAPFSYQNCSPEDINENYYTAECDKCSWWGSSKFLNGGEAIADTGDHFDCTCPVCGNYDVNEKIEK